MKSPVFGLVVALAGAALVVAPAIVSAGGGHITLGVTPRRLTLLATDSGQPVSATFTVVVDTTSPTDLRISLTDAVPGQDGLWDAAPPGSTPYSASATTTVDPTLVTVQPTGANQTLTITVTTRPLANETPRAGLITVSLLPHQDGSTSDGATVGQGLAVTVPVIAGISPDFLIATAGATASLAGTGVSVARKAPSFTPVDSLVPDIFPALVDPGPVTTTALFTNTGNVVLDTVTDFEFASVSPLAALPGSSEAGTPFNRYVQAHTYALPGQPASATGSSLIEQEGVAPIDSLPFIGVVRITATTTGTLGSLSATPIVQSTVIVIFPWKELLALVLLLVLLRVLRALLGRGWRRLRGRGKGGPTAGATGGSGDFQAAEQDSGMADRLSNF